MAIKRKANYKETVETTKEEANNTTFDVDVDSALVVEVDVDAAPAPVQEVAKPQTRGVVAGRPSVLDTGLSDEEMEDLEFGFGTFPIITLNGEFECADDTIEVEGGFECVILSYKARYIYRCDEENFFYTYYNAKRDAGKDDLRVTTSGESMDDKLAEWGEEELKHEIKKYLEVVVLMKGANEGKICLLSVSPTSVGRFSGYVAMELHQLKGLHYSEVITRCSLGAKINSKYAFKPWHFEFVSVD